MRKLFPSQAALSDMRAIKALRISIASPEHMRSWSSGEVTKAETINYRTLKPEPDGLCCERIFGPTKNWACACGKYQGLRRKGTICEKCGVQVGPASMRRRRMGHIELAAPVCHPWYARAMPSRIGLLLDLPQRAIEHILAYTHMLVVHIDETARLAELERLTTEIEHLKPSLYEPETPSRSANETAYTLTSASKQHGAAVLVRTERRTAGSLENSTVSRADLQTILHDLRALAGLGHGKVLEKRGDDIDIEPLEEEEQPESRQDAWELAFQQRSLEKRIDELQRAKTLLAALAPRSLLELEDVRFLSRESGHVFKAETGAAAIEALLQALDLDQVASALRREIQNNDDSTRTRAIQRLKVVEALRRSETRPEWLVLHVIPVLPPDLRPVLALDGGRFAASDSNELYSRVLHCNNRLKRFLAIGAPEPMIFHEQRALQAACDALFANGHLARPRLGSHGQPLRSLSDSLSGKDGRFRRNLLGKRVDYSGRSVISVGLDLKIHQCGLPKKIALELFKPFVIQKLVAYAYYATPRRAKRAVERRDPVVWNLLDEVMRDRVVLLNRAPTLHRLSIQAFEPVLIEGNALRLHPQVCSAFNADFDGDQMAVHLPLSANAQKEARELLLSTRNLLSPASGEPAISIAQEQVLGCYYLTQERPGRKGEGHIFSSPEEAVLAYTLGSLDLQARIVVRLDATSIFEQPPPAFPMQQPAGKRVQTTVGRLIFNEALPVRLRFRNYPMKKDSLKHLVWEAIKSCGLERTAVMADAIKRLGFQYATRAAFSFSLADVKVPPQKKDILARADQQIEELRDEWHAGLITREELSTRSIDIWQKATEQVAQHVQEVLDPYGSVATIANSGATKAKLQQIRQLSGMRGLMASPSGAIIEIPVRGNFLEGLSVFEYFLSSHGARKSMMDRSLNTAQSGYLTIQFVNAAQELIVTEEDCGTQEGLLVTEADSASLGLADSSSRLIGRILAEDLPTASLNRGDELDELAVERIAAARIGQVRVRSVLCCQTRRGVCRACYGWDLSRRALVAPGTAVGIIAAQSIGEPGTQLTMRTFHSGGIAGGQGDITQGIPRIKELFEARIPRTQAIVSDIAGVVTPGKDEKNRKLVVSNGQHVHAHDALTTGSRNPHAILREQGREELALYLLKEAQLVYRTTGAYIHDKHFEVIFRQMLRYVQIETPGDTQLVPGDLVDRFTSLDTNARVLAQGGEPASAHPVLLGLIRATLATESWLAAASFQETSRVLTEAALEGRVDWLRGLKENVILGKLIPAGTGLLANPEPAVRSVPGRRRGRPAKQRV